MEIPNIFSDLQTKINFNYEVVDNLINSEVDKSYEIDNIYSPLLFKEKKDVVKDYFKSIMGGYNHVLITKYLNLTKSLSNNIVIPYLNDWNKNISIDNLVIISNPNDSERIAKKHIKKAPIFKNVVFDSVISTTDNEQWKNQRYDLNTYFLPNLSLKQIFDLSKNRAKKCNYNLKNLSNNYKESVNMSDYFLNETQAQLQLVLFGFDSEFENQTNKKIRDAFSGKNTDYTKDFSINALKETKKSKGPLSLYFQNNNNSLETNIGNILLFAFAGHDTTGHTLTWLLYELCKNPKCKEKLINEIDNYWKLNNEENYESFNDLPYMSRCITETLRLWPALANGTFRELEYDDEINGIDGKVKLKKGTYCQIFNWTKHRNPELWGEDANNFNPDRKFTDKELWNETFSGYLTASERFSPFTYSPRNCLGRNFSHIEMRLILLNIFKNHDFNLDSKQELLINNPKYLGVNFFTLGPKSIKNNELLGMYINVFKRKHNL